jgi:hypothetical protein
MNNLKPFLWPKKYNKINELSLHFFTLDFQFFSSNFNNSCLKSFLHSTAIIKSDSNKPLPQDLEAAGSSKPRPFTSEASGRSKPRSAKLEAVKRLEYERPSDLNLIKYTETQADEDV